MELHNILLASRTIIRQGSALCLLAVLAAWAGAAAAQDAYVRLDDPSPTHVHAPGQAFSVMVTISDPGLSSPSLRAQWLDPAGQPLAPTVELVPDQPLAIEAPDLAPGHYDLRVWSDNPQVRFPPQDAGFHLDFGFAVMPGRTLQDRLRDDGSFFGMIHPNLDDPYLRGWVKTLTWNTAAPANFAQRIAELNQGDRVQELPMVNESEWETDDDAPVSDAQINALGERFGTYLDALQAAGVDVPAWQLGREENRDGQFEQPFFFANLKRKAERLRLELDQREMQDVLTIFSMRGFHYPYFTAFASSEAASFFDVLGFHPYKWNDFPSPDTEGEWLRTHIESVADIMQTHGGPTRLWMTEFGIPHQGNNNPAGFFGYPASGAVVEGGTREHAARYIVKSHVISMATRQVERIFFYNYYDRGDDEEYAEHHFGLRMHAPLTTSGDDDRDGHTKPAYVAYMHMVEQLNPMAFRSARQPSADVWVYEFAARDTASDARTLVAWSSPGTSQSVALADLHPGLTAANVAAADDLYGADVELNNGEVLLGARPVYLRLEPEMPSSDDTPQAVDDTANTLQGKRITVDVLANDSGLLDTPLIVLVAQNPTHGTADVLGDNSIRYTPHSEFSGVDTLIYRVADADLDLTSATLTITVDPAPAEPPPPPTALDDGATTVQNSSVTIDVLANDSGLGDTPLVVTVVGAPAHGTAAVVDGTHIEYTPDDGFSGEDTFIYLVEDASEDQSSATVSVTVTAALPAPPETPMVTLAASPSSVPQGGETTLSWQSSHAESCVATGYWSGSLELAGEVIVGPLLVASQFGVSCSGPGGTATDGVSVTVTVLQEDSDEDGLPDAWERSFFGDLSPSGGGDPDADGLSNLEELASGTFPDQADTDMDGAPDGAEVTYGSDPTSAQDNWQERRPERPTVVNQWQPIELLDPVFDTLNGFSDPNGNAFAGADWQLADDHSFGRLVFARSVSTGTALRLPPGLLALATTYSLRTRHWDASGLPSRWSEPVIVTTPAVDSADEDGDGTDDAYQVSVFSDLDSDGLDDNAQSAMCVMYDAESRSIIGIRAGAGQMRCVTAIPASGIPAGLRDADEELPLGLFAFRVSDLPVQPGAPAELDVTFFLPNAVPDEAQWFLFDSVVQQFEPFRGVRDSSGQRVVLHYIDGGRGDKDGVVNGIIVDPVGPVLAAAPPDDDGSAPPPVAPPLADNDEEGGSGAMSPGALLAMLLLFGSQRRSANGLSQGQSAQAVQADPFAQA